MITTATEKDVFICRHGENNSAIKATKLTKNELKIILSYGWEIAVHCEGNKRTICCPVNGEMYSYRIRYLRDSDNNIVGHYKVLEF